ncbi:MAG: hypothetical protein ACI4OJ_09560 [Lachnospiraceae bacterium]
MTRCTSAEAAKILRQLQGEKSALEERENTQKSYVSSLDPDDMAMARPDYNYAATQQKLQDLEAQIRKVKHAINVFNLNTIVPGTNMTIDQVLVYLPQLSARVEKLGCMSRRLARERMNGLERSYSGQYLVEYRFANYDPEMVMNDWRSAQQELSQVQTSLDRVNSTAVLTIPD